MGQFNVVAAGNISPSCFCTPAGDDQAQQAVANQPLIGISFEGSDYAPLSDLVTTPYAAVAGENFRLYGEGEMCQVVAGAAWTIAAGQVIRLKSDVNGNAVPIATTGTVIQECGAVPMESSPGAGALVRVKVKNDRILPAAA